MSETIVHGLAVIAREWRAVAIAWHAAAALLMAVLVLGGGTKRLVAEALTVPVFSVAALAWWSGNPFNGAVFSVTGVVLLVLAARVPDSPVAFASRWQIAAGVSLCAFGWVYPHFLEGPWWHYLYQAPLGLIPCPTLTFIVGISLITQSFQSSGWAFAVAWISALYGVTGVFVLGVGIDWVLVAGAALLAAHGSIRLLHPSDLHVLEQYRRTL